MTRNDIKPGALIARPAHTLGDAESFIVTGLETASASLRNDPDYTSVMMMSLTTCELDSCYVYIVEGFFDLIAPASGDNDT